VTADPWDGPTCTSCKGKGEIVFTRRNHWTSVECVDCYGTGLADATSPDPRYRPDGYRIPEDGEAYDPEEHGPVPFSPWGRRDH
jgi:hypothetical protein